MSAGSVGSNYISDGAIMAWLATQQDRVYGDLKDAMDLSQKRADLATALNTIKADLQEAGQTNDFTKVDAELQDVFNTYGDDPELAKLLQGINTLTDKIHADVQWATEGYPAAKAEYDAAVAGTGTGDNEETSRNGEHTSSTAAASSGSAGDPEPPEAQYREHTADQVKGWLDDVTGCIDVSGKNDQLTMIHIQQLKSTIDQGAQLGSTFIAGSDKSLSSIINNIA
jgi:hypothetical protein